MAVAQISILSKDEIELIHQKTLMILEDPGIMVRSDPTLDILEEGGATVDRRRQVARLPESLIKETVRRLPKEIRLCARNPRQDMIAPRDGPPYMATNGTAIYMSELDSGARHTTLGKDLKDFMVLCDAMDPLDYVWPIVTAHDAPDETHALSELTISLLNTTKHVQGEAMSAEEAKGEVEVASAIAGGADALAKRPLFSVIQCPICPLEFEKGSVEAVVEFAKAGVPVVSMSMALTGLTSPVTLASTIAIVNAENLASFAISQMTKKGAPVVYSSESTSPNMMTGEIHYGSLEEILIATAAAQMAKSYGATTMVGGFGVGIGGEAPGIYLDPAELIFTSMTTMAQTDFGSGIGGLDQAKGASLEQIVIDCDIWEQIREMRKDVPLDDPRFVLDLIKSVGPGGNFLKEAHTAKNMRRELFMPSQEKAQLYRTYGLNRDQKEMVSAARKKVKQILATHVPEQVDVETKKRVDEILRKYES
jgi:trimethylamine--corrinoid protein Co-methyltransferase